MKNKDIQLFILPYAGGSIAAFKRLTDLIEKRIEVITVEYAGRGMRAREPLACSIEEMLRDAANYCRERRNPEIGYAIMGYSMGSILAYEMISRKMLETSPKHMFLSAEISPQMRSMQLMKQEKPTDQQIIERAKSLGGLDNRILENKRFSGIYVRPMVSDYRNFYGYRFCDNKEVLRVDTTFFFCGKDTPLNEIKAWSELISGEHDFYEYGDNHFFINQFYTEMADVININLRKYL